MNLRNVKTEYYDLCLNLWERFIKTTHSFLILEDFAVIKYALPSYFSVVQVQSGSLKDQNIGFSAINDHHLEVLFIDRIISAKVMPHRSSRNS